jgi:hypothetical protein
MSHTPLRRGAALAALVAAGVIAAPGAAQAQTAAVAGGSTTLRLSATAASALSSLGVSAAPISPARAGSAGIRFPITGGRLDPATVRGAVDHSGGLRLRGGGVTVRLTRPRITNQNGVRTLSTVVNGTGRIHTFTLDLGAARIARDGLGTVASNVRVRLSLKGAQALNRAFGVTAFRRGLLVGTARVVAQPGEVVFTGGGTELALDAAAAGALQSLGIAAAPAGAATATEAGALRFPITRGRVDAGTLAGTINHSGGITLSRGGTAVTVERFVIDTTQSQLTAFSPLGRIPLATLDLSAAQPAISGRSVTVAGVGVRLSGAAAGALNQVFGTTAFTEGLLLGTATVRGQAR